MPSTWNVRTRAAATITMVADALRLDEDTGILWFYVDSDPVCMFNLDAWDYVQLVDGDWIELWEAHGEATDNEEEG